MNDAAVKDNKQTQFWMMLGPLFIASTLFVTALRPATGLWSLPMVAIVGLLLCLKWRWKGVLAGVGMLLVALVVYLNAHATQGMWWPIVLFLSIASGFVTTVLGMEESFYAWDMLNKETHDQKKMITSFNQRMQQSQHEFDREHQKISSQLEQINQALVQKNEDIKQKDEEIHSMNRLLFLARDELNTMASVADEKNTLQMTVKELSKQLYEQSTQFQQLKSRWEEDVKRLEYLRSVQGELQELMGGQEDQQTLCNQLQHEKETLQQSHDNLRNEYEKLVNSIAKTEPELPGGGDSREIRRLEGLHQQLREQFVEKSALLTATRKELFLAQEMLVAFHKESEDAKMNNEIENEYYFGKILSSAERELAESEQKDLEIEHLHEIICGLMDTKG